MQERESGFFTDLECLLERLIPLEAEERTRLVSMLLGPRTEQIPFSDGSLCLGQYQRIFLVAIEIAAAMSGVDVGPKRRVLRGARVPEMRTCR